MTVLHLRRCLAVDLDVIQTYTRCDAFDSVGCHVSLCHQLCFGLTLSWKRSSAQLLAVLGRKLNNERHFGRAFRCNVVSIQNDSRWLLTSEFYLRALRWLL